MSRVGFVFMLLALVLSSVDSRHSRMLLNSDTCDIDGTFTDTEEIQCNDDYSCDQCSLITCTECEKVTCNGFKSCWLSTIVATADSDSLTVNCNAKKACKTADITLYPDGYDVEYVKCNGRYACQGATVTIDCEGGKMKGVNCDGYMACLDATFVITDCDLEKFECSANAGCDTITCSGDNELCPTYSP